MSTGHAAMLKGKRNRDWWPEQPDLSLLRQNHPNSDPMGPGYNYREEVETLDVEQLRRDIYELMTTPHSSSA
jgi:catalase-peroxidase